MYEPARLRVAPLRPDPMKPLRPSNNLLKIVWRGPDDRQTSQTRELGPPNRSPARGAVEALLNTWGW